MAYISYQYTYRCNYSGALSMKQLITPAANKHNHMLPINQQLALLIFYRPEHSQQLTNAYSNSNTLTKSLVFQLKNAIKDVLISTQTILWERGFLQGSVLIGPRMDSVVNMIIAEGANSCFSSHLLAFHRRDKTMNYFKDQDLIKFYNQVISLWAERKGISKMESIQLEEQSIKGQQTQRIHQDYNQSKKKLDNLQNLFESLKPQSNQISVESQQSYQQNVRPTPSDASLQFLKEFTSDLMKSNPRENCRTGTKTIIALDRDEPSLSFHYYDSLENILFEVFLVAANHQVKLDPATKNQYEG